MAKARHKDIEVVLGGLLTAIPAENGWVVERFFAWISRNRSLYKDSEATLAAARAFLYAASVMILIRRVAGS
jgi:hypothetical protein